MWRVYSVIPQTASGFLPQTYPSQQLWFLGRIVWFSPKMICFLHVFKICHSEYLKLQFLNMESHQESLEEEEGTLALLQSCHKDR